MKIKQVTEGGRTFVRGTYYDQDGKRRRLRFPNLEQAETFRVSLLDDMAGWADHDGLRLQFLLPFVAKKRLWRQQRTFFETMLNLDRDLRYRDHACRIKLTIFEVLHIEWWRQKGVQDVDNIAKPVLDLMRGWIYRDDRQVFELVCKRVISDEPKTLVEIEYISDAKFAACYVDPALNGKTLTRRILAQTA